MDGKIRTQKVFTCGFFGHFLFEDDTFFQNKVCYVMFYMWYVFFSFLWLIRIKTFPPNIIRKKIKSINCSRRSRNEQIAPHHTNSHCCKRNTYVQNLNLFISEAQCKNPKIRNWNPSLIPMLKKQGTWWKPTKNIVGSLLAFTDHLTSWVYWMSPVINLASLTVSLIKISFI